MGARRLSEAIGGFQVKVISLGEEALVKRALSRGKHGNNLLKREERKRGRFTVLYGHLFKVFGGLDIL